jgi:hypothetical protein
MPFVRGIEELDVLARLYVPERDDGQRAGIDEYVRLA